jgi:hypothetical protein
MAEEEIAELFELAWNTYPNDRRRNRGECEKHFRAAIEKGAKPAAIIRATQNYEETSRSYTRSKVRFSDNWFKNIDWHQFIEQEAIESNNLDDAMRRSLDLCVEWINKGALTSQPINLQHCWMLAALQLNNWSKLD